MGRIVLETFVRAPAARCFDLARSTNAHVASQGDSGERVIAAPRELLELGDAVTWEARHLGIRQRLTARIIQMHPPTEFSDDQIEGAFHSFRHVHRFNAVPGGTLVVDDFTYRVPLGWIGLVVDVLLVRGYMRALLRRRAMFLRRLAESTAYVASPLLPQ
jgi:ligand-binding SRPBCC domain-containing protein